MASAGVLSASLIGASFGALKPGGVHSQTVLEDAHRAVHKVLVTDRETRFDDSDVRVFPRIGLVCGGRLQDAQALHLGVPDYNFSGDLGPGLKGDHSSPWAQNEARCRKESAR